VETETLRLLSSYRNDERFSAAAFLKSRTLTWAKAAALVSNWGLKQLADRLSNLAEERLPVRDRLPSAFCTA
jgi:hypothetical protein